jgi:hypothetical protein
MTVTKSLLSAVFAFTLASGAAFAGQNSTVRGSAETSPPDWLSEQYAGPNSDESFTAGLSGSQSMSSMDSPSAPSVELAGLAHAAP